MEIVIDIPENEVPDCQEIISMNLHFIHKEVCECTYPFKVLPEHHGDLKDVSEVITYCDNKINENVVKTHNYPIATAYDNVKQELIDLLTIIPATKEGDGE